MWGFFGGDIRWGSNVTKLLHFLCVGHILPELWGTHWNMAIPLETWRGGGQIIGGELQAPAIDTRYMKGKSTMHMRDILFLGCQRPTLDGQPWFCPLSCCTELTIFLTLM